MVGPVPVAVSDREGHVIVCGLEGVGLRTVEQLRLSGVDVVVVDDDPDRRRAQLVQTWGARHVTGSARIGSGLQEADLDRAAAVVCALNDEVAALEVALRVRELRPDVRLVVQMANPAVAAALAEVIGNGRVLDVATLAAPTFVEACSGVAAHALQLEDVGFSVVEIPVGGSGSGGTLRHRFGSLVPVAVVPADGGDLVVCPGRDHPVHPGDRAALLGTDEELADLGLRSAASRPAASRLAPVVRVYRRLQLATSAGSGRALAAAVLVLMALVVASSAVLRLGYRASGPSGGLDTLSSIYFTVETLATVGFGDFSFAHQAAWLQVFGIGLIVVGVTAVTTVFALFTNILVGRRLDQSLGRHEVGLLRDHVIVVGLGAVGIRVVEGLVVAGRGVVVVERDSSNRYLGRARALRVPVVIADATQRQTHRLVRLEHAAAVAVLTSADLTNIETGLALRDSLGARRATVPVALRIFDRNLARMMERSFGFRHVRSTAALAAPWFAGAALGLDVLETFYVDQEPFLVGAVSVSPGGGLEGLAMQDLSARTRVIAIRRAASAEALEHPPRRGTRFAGGDRAYILGPYEELLRVLRRDRPICLTDDVGPPVLDPQERDPQEPSVAG